MVMNLIWLILAAGMLWGAYSLGMHHGRIAGREWGYNLCVGEEDEDYPRTYSRALEKRRDRAQ